MDYSYTSYYNSQAKSTAMVCSQRKYFHPVYGKTISSHRLDIQHFLEFNGEIIQSKILLVFCQGICHSPSERQNIQNWAFSLFFMTVTSSQILYRMWLCILFKLPYYLTFYIREILIYLRNGNVIMKLWNNLLSFLIAIHDEVMTKSF